MHFFFFFFFKEVYPAFHNKNQHMLLEFLNDYEIVVVKSNHILKRTKSVRKYKNNKKKHVYPININFQFAAFGKYFQLRVRKNFKIFGPNYKEELQINEHGINISTKTRHWSHQSHNCHYIGEIQGEKSSSVAVSTCRGSFSGSLSDNHNTYGIEPASEQLTLKQLSQIKKKMNYHDITSLHVVFITKESNFPFWSCGVKYDNAMDDKNHDIHILNNSQTFVHNHKSSHGFEYSSRRKSNRFLKQTDQMYVELFIVNDYLRYKELGDEAFDQTAAIINQVYKNYKYSKILDINPSVVLVGQIAWAHGYPSPVDQIVYGSSICLECSEDEISVVSLLEKFDNWRLAKNYQPEYDNCHMFSGFDFEGNTLGYAHVASLCTPGISSGINQITPSLSVAFNAAIVTHEMGHNFGMSHDGEMGNNKCEESGWFMNSVVNNIPTEFSICSDMYVRDAISMFTCLNNKPEKHFGDSICGNGLIEDGEECDCGAPDCSVDNNIGDTEKCCNGTSCQFVLGAECLDHDLCCDNCKIIPFTIGMLPCRGRISECDIPEYCDGKSGKCPHDYTLGSGTYCEDQPYGEGFCHQGHCMSHLRQCIEMGKKFKDTYEGCHTQKVQNGGQFCGILWCTNRPGTCVSLQQSGQPVWVTDGIPCGNDDKIYQCLDGQCVPSNLLNPAIIWKHGPWSSCSSCEMLQTRDINCFNSQTNTIINPNVCSPVNMPSTTQKCNNKSLACVHTTNNFRREGNHITIMIDNVGKQICYIFSIIFVLVLIIIICCYRAITYDPVVRDNQKLGV